MLVKRCGLLFLLAIGLGILAGTGCNKSTGPEIKLSSPLNGPYTAGSIVTIKWTVSDIADIPAVGIKLSTDNGKTFTDLSSNPIPSNTLAYEWAVDSAQASTGCIIMVYNRDDPSISAKSGTFTVQLQSPTKPLELLYPLGGEAFKVGKKLLVKWKINDPMKVSSVGVKIKLDNNPYYTLLVDHSFPPDTTSFSLTVKSTLVSNICKIMVYEYNGNCAPDSSGIFYIAK